MLYDGVFDHDSMNAATADARGSTPAHIRATPAITVSVIPVSIRPISGSIILGHGIRGGCRGEAE